MLRRLVVIVVITHTVISFGNDTELSLYRPFAETTKHLPITIESNQHGHCREQAQRIIREDAWHCESDTGKTYDPCFSKRFGSNTTVICPESPWSEKGIQMTLDQPLDERDQLSLDMSSTLPWAVELKSGERCLSVNPIQRIDNLPVHYQCTGGVVLMGNTHRCANVWTILKNDANGVSMNELSRVWF